MELPVWKKNRMPWTSSICECSVTQNCQRGRKHLLENFIYKTYHSLLWILNGLRLNHRHFIFFEYTLIVIYYLLLQLLPILNTVHRSTLYAKFCKGSMTISIHCKTTLFIAWFIYFCSQKGFSFGLPTCSLRVRRSHGLFFYLYISAIFFFFF